MDYRKEIEHIKARFLRGELTYDEAKALVTPLLDEMNKKGKEIAKEYGRKFKPFTFSYIFR